MRFILLNCTPKLKAMGIDPTVSTWGSQFESKIASYATLAGWTYDPVSDTIVITPVDGTSVSTNLTDFGDAGGMML